MKATQAGRPLRGETRWPVSETRVVNYTGARWAADRILLTSAISARVALLPTHTLCREQGRGIRDGPEFGAKAGGEANCHQHDRAAANASRDNACFDLLYLLQPSLNAPARGC